MSQSIVSETLNPQFDQHFLDSYTPVNKDKKVRCLLVVDGGGLRGHMTVQILIEANIEWLQNCLKLKVP